MVFIPRFLEPPADPFFLLGPRGTGKTSWTKAVFPDALRIDLLDPATLRELAAKPERLRERVAGSPGLQTVLVDEVQKLPQLLEVIHALIEEKLGIQFILAGSSARKLRRTGVNLLGGRAAQKRLHPYMASELGTGFRLEEALRLGLLPVVLAAKNREEMLLAYNGLYLREEVQAEGLVRNTGNFARFLEAISFSHASVLNLANVARDCQVSRKTVEGYLEILEDLLLGFQLPVFTRRAQLAMAAHPKFFFFDAGVFRANRPTGPLDSPSEIDGAALEGLIAQHLRAWCDYTPGEHQLAYWQTRSQKLLRGGMPSTGSSGFLWSSDTRFLPPARTRRSCRGIFSGGRIRGCWNRRGRGSRVSRAPRTGPCCWRGRCAQIQWRQHTCRKRQIGLWF